MENCLDMRLSKVLELMQHRILQESTYFGVKTLKSPTDFWVYQEIIYEYRPDVILEIGNYGGGSALALAHILDIMGHGRIIGLDISHESIPESVKQHPRITFIEGDACESVNYVSSLIRKGEKVLIIEDSAHTYENTLNVLRTYSSMVGSGGYFIVEDSICHHGLDAGPRPGPYEAIETFMEGNSDYEIDRARESFLITWNPKGYLRRK